MILSIDIDWYRADKTAAITLDRRHWSSIQTVREENVDPVVATDGATVVYLVYQPWWVLKAKKERRGIQLFGYRNEFKFAREATTNV